MKQGIKQDCIAKKEQEIFTFLQC